MTDIVNLRFRRRAVGGAAGAPTTLRTAEPSYNMQDGKLYLGYGDNGSGVATGVKVFGRDNFIDNVPAGGSTGQILQKVTAADGDWAWSTIATGGGTVTAVSVATANGVSGTSSGGSTPALTITLGAITPSSVASTGALSGTTLTATGLVSTPASIAGSAGLRVAPGVAPTAPVDGDFWGTTTTLFSRHSGVTKTVAFTDSALTGSTTGSAATLTTPRAIGINAGGITATGVNFDGSAAINLSASVDAGHITLARMANLAANSIIGNNTGAGATPIALTAAQVKTLLAISLADVSGFGTGVSTFLGTPTSANLISAITDETGTGSLVFASGPTLIAPVLGTPASATLTNATGLPVSTGISGLAAGVATFLAAPSSANLIAAVTDETGTGSLVFGTSPALTTPSLSGETFSTAATVTAGTNAQGQAALTNDLNIITVTAANPSGATLPTATAGRRVIVVNRGTNPVNIYPASGAAIDLLASNASISLPVNGSMEFNANTTTAWQSSSTNIVAVSSLSGLATGVSTFLATPTSANLISAVTDETGTGSLVFASGPTLIAPVLGTPASATLTNATGLPISTGVSGLATGIAAFLGTPTSANLIAAVTDETGTGSLVFANGPTLIAPALGTPASAVLTNATGLPVATGISGLATGIATFLATPSSANLISAVTDETGTGSLVFANGPTLIAPALGTPASGVLTNATGLPISTGVSGLAAGIAAFLATPSSANLITAVTDETGTGSLVFGTNPSLTTPALAGETYSTAPTVTAGTNAQGQGALTSDFNVITTASANPSGVTLPTATVGRRVVVVNRGANPINVYPAAGAAIDGAAANAAVSIPVNGYREFNANTTTAWLSSINETAAVLATPRAISITGGGITATGVNFDGSAAIALSASVDAAHITLARMANLPANTFIGNNTGSSATPLALTVAQVKTQLAYAFTDITGTVSNAQLATGIDGSKITVGTIDPSVLPAALFAAPIVATSNIASLDAGQQSSILGGSTVVTSDGRFWMYKGSGSKTLEASYQELADTTPEWTVIANKPTFATVATSGLYSDLTGRPTLGTMSSQNASAVAITGGTIDGVTITNVTLDGGTF